MRAEIFSIGNELVEGRVADTNAPRLAAMLHRLGFTTALHRTLPDRGEEIVEALRDACVRGADLVVATGGLGPTADDITRESVARAFDLRLVFHEEAWRNIRKRFAAASRVPAPNNRKQAFVPEGADVFVNTCGTAPGFALVAGTTRVCVLPGVPREMEEMAETALIPYLRSSFSLEEPPPVRVFKTLEIGESDVGARLEDLMARGRNPRVDVTVDEGIVTVRVCARPGTPVELVERDARVVRDRLGDAVWTEEDVSLEEHIVRLLEGRGLTIALAESCTGGLGAAGLVSVPGCSHVLVEAVVAYDNRSKVSRLGVSPRTLDRHGAVSAETAREMAAGIRRTAGADVGAAVTGIAGPGGGTPGKPVGTVWLCVSAGGYEKTAGRLFTGDRARVRRRAVTALYSLIRECVTAGNAPERMRRA